MPAMKAHMKGTAPSSHLYRCPPWTLNGCRGGCVMKIRNLYFYPAEFHFQFLNLTHFII